MDSMTGFGRGEASSSGKKAAVEVKSLNHRFLDIRCRIPRSHNALELRIHQLVKAGFHRGRFDVEIRIERETDAAAPLQLDEAQARAVFQAYTQLKSSLDLPGEINLALITSHRDIWKSEPTPEEIESDWETIRQAVELATRDLGKMRTQEGHAIAEDISERIKKIDHHRGEILAASRGIVEQTRERLSRLVQDALEGTSLPNLDRLEQEVVLLAERSDISEELTRLESHLLRFREAMGESPAGKKLEFLLQEMGRETNTIGSKSSSTNISQHVVEIKLELEKIREQVQNIE